MVRSNSKRFNSLSTPQQSDPLDYILSMAYQPSSGLYGGMSVDLERSILEVQLDPIAFVTTPQWIGFVLFRSTIESRRFTGRRSSTSR